MHNPFWTYTNIAFWTFDLVVFRNLRDMQREIMKMDGIIASVPAEKNGAEGDGNESD